MKSSANRQEQQKLEDHHTFVSNYRIHNGSIYTGQMLNKKFDGQGTLIYPNGQKYEGEFKNGMKNGKGKYYYLSGEYFIGDWLSNKKQGKGLYIYNDQKRYQGEFKNSMKHGRGKIIQDNGSWYEGEFYENQKDDQGDYFDAIKKKKFRFYFDKGKQLNCFEINIESNDILEGKDKNEKDQKALRFLNLDPDRIISHLVSTILKDDKQVSTFKIAEYTSMTFPKQNQADFNSKTQKQATTSHRVLKNQSLLSKKINEWGFDEVSQWLQQIEFADFDSEFQSQHILGRSLLLLKQNDLRQLTVANISDRKILMKQIQLLKMIFKKQCLGEKISKVKNCQLRIDLIKQLNRQERKANQLALKNINQLSMTHNFSIAQGNNSQYSCDSSSSISQENDSLIKKIKRKQKKTTMEKKVEKYLMKKGLIMKSMITKEDIKIIEVIGKGGYGEVLLANWLGQKVAVKNYQKRKGLRNRHIAHFLEETEIIHRLAHPNIVLYMGCYFDHNEYSLVMEYLPGGSLFDYLHIKGYKPSQFRIYKICRDIALGMAYLHGRNIIHCDLKSSNILIDENNKIKISDFGLSQFIKNKTENKFKKIGTPQWMAPEVIKDHVYDFSSDVFSFGMIIWELATGQIPFRQYTEKETINLLISKDEFALKSPAFQNQILLMLFYQCIQRVPSKRITFIKIVEILLMAERTFIAKLN